jgi:hypothetical protein
MNRYLAYAAAAVLALTFGQAQAGNINVLWYTGGVQNDYGTYQTDVNQLAALAPTSPGANNWNVTFWDSGAMPTGSYNVLVVTSPEGGWGINPDYSALSTAISGGLSLGDRIMLTGQDADWHYMHSPGGASDSVNPSAGFDGPTGFLLDSINWAGSGTGLGVVDLGATGTGVCAGGVDFGLAGYSTVCNSTDSVLIPGAVAANPVNTDLTSAGLSNWGTSAHTEFTSLDSSLWTGINVDGSNPTNFVTIVSASTAGGGIGGGTGTVPEPGTLWLVAPGVLLLLARRRRAAV